MLAVGAGSGPAICPRSTASATSEDRPHCWARQRYRWTSTGMGGMAIWGSWRAAAGSAPAGGADPTAWAASAAWSGTARAAAAAATAVWAAACAATSAASTAAWASPAPPSAPAPDVTAAVPRGPAAWATACAAACAAAAPAPLRFDAPPFRAPPFFTPAELARRGPAAAPVAVDVARGPPERASESDAALRG